MRHAKTQAVFKPYAPNQLSLLRPILDELIDANHPSWGSKFCVIDKLGISQLEVATK